MFCKYCGKELDDGSAFCKYCGKAQSTASSAPAQPAAEPPAQNSTADAVQRTMQNVVQKAAQSAAAGADAARNAAQKAAYSAAAGAVQETAQNAVHSVMQKARRPISKEMFLRRLKATCKMLSMAGWASLVVGTLLAVLAALTLLVAIFTLNPAGLSAPLILALVSAWCYFFGVRQFWHAVVVEEGLTVALPAGKSDAEWLASIRDEFSFEGARLSETQPENAVVYLMNRARVQLEAENGVLHIVVKHSRRFNSAESGGHWELQESFHADDLKCALHYFLKGEPLPDSFAQDQKAAHKDKVGSVKKGLVAATVVLVLLVTLIALFGNGPVSALKNSVWSQYDSSGVTLGEAFEQNFYDTSWKATERDGNQYVEFTGLFDVEGYGTNLAEIIFSVKETDSSQHFLVFYASINDVVLSDYEEAALMQYGFDGNADDLISAFFVSWLFG